MGGSCSEGSATSCVELEELNGVGVTEEDTYGIFAEIPNCGSHPDTTKVEDVAKVETQGIDRLFDSLGQGPRTRRSSLQENGLETAGCGGSADRPGRPVLASTICD